MGVQIKGGNSSSGLANVSTNNDLNVVTPTNAGNAGFVQLSTENDSGSVTGLRNVKEAEITEDYRLRVGTDTINFNLSFEGTNLPQGHITSVVSGGAMSQASGFLLSTGTVTSGQYVITKTLKTFTLFGSYLTYGELWISETAGYNTANSVSEWGFGIPSTSTAAVTDGVFFRRLSGGGLAVVLSFNSVELETAIVTTNLKCRDGVSIYDPTLVHHYLISVGADGAKFWINNTLVANIRIPSNQTHPSQACSLPLFIRNTNPGTPSPATARIIKCGLMSVSQGDLISNKPWSHIMSGSGGGAYQVQPGTASSYTANWANSAAPASASLSNTTAGYSTLGGQWQFAASATNETDWALFAYTNPAASTSLPGKTLHVTSIRIGETVVTGAAGVNATSFFWFAGAGAQGASAVSLAVVADTTIATQARRIALGSQSFLASAPIGTQAPGFTVDFSEGPLVVPAGCVFHIGVKQLNGAATASLVWRGTVTVVGYFE